MRCRIECRRLGLVVVACAALGACTDRSLVDGDGGGAGNEGNDHDPSSEGGEGNHDDGIDEAEDAEGATLPDTGFDEADAGEEADATTDASEPLPCASVLAESRQCATLGYDAVIHVLGLGSGESCELLQAEWPADGTVGDYPGGLAWIDDSFYTCAGVLAQIGPDGIVSGSEVPCDWVAGRDGALLLYEESSLVPLVSEYAGWPEVLALDLTATYSVSDMQASRFAAAGPLLYGAWHSTDRVLRLGLDTGELQSDVTLVGFDDWVDGIDVDAGELLISSHSMLHRFEPEIGTQIGSAIELDTGSSGAAIDCRSL
jgi:hypothetical protein